MKIYSIKEIVQATNDIYKKANNITVKEKGNEYSEKEKEPLILADSIEEKTKLNFFSELSDNQQELFESRVNLSNWAF